MKEDLLQLGSEKAFQAKSSCKLYKMKEKLPQTEYVFSESSYMN